eukprot:scaffold29248_cov140-Skeletonema_dohrnii-CCMP3373.AAC.2
MHHSKKQKLIEDGQQNGGGMTTDDDDNCSSFERLGTDELANIFGFLPPKDIMRARLNKKMREAAKKTIVPKTDFVVDSVKKCNAMAAMSTALPNLQQISLSRLNDEGQGHKHKYSDGDDPDEEWAAYSSNWITHDIEILSRFRKLHSLDIVGAPLNGRYPFLFNFPLLQQLKIHYSRSLKFDLEMLAGLPLLKELRISGNDFVTGNLKSLRLLKDDLAVVHISLSHHVQGNFMDLADFPRLRTLNLEDTGVTGDIRDIGEQDFRTLESLTLPKGVYGGRGHEFQHISDVPGVMNTLYSLKKQRPRLLLKDWYGKLSYDSPDWYDMDHDLDEAPPFQVWLVQAGSRAGYRWQVADDMTCEVNWLDPEPGRESSKYEKYIRDLREIERQVVYRGFQQPPSEEEFNRHLLERYGDGIMLLL